MNRQQIDVVVQEIIEDYLVDIENTDLSVIHEYTDDLYGVEPTDAEGDEIQISLLRIAKQIRHDL